MKVRMVTSNQYQFLLALPFWIHTYSGADLYAKDKSLCTPIHTAALHQLTDVFHCLMKRIPFHAHPSVIFTVFEVKCSKEIILKVSMKHNGRRGLNATSVGIKAACCKISLCVTILTVNFIICNLMLTVNLVLVWNGSGNLSYFDCYIVFLSRTELISSILKPKMHMKAFE